MVRHTYFQQFNEDYQNITRYSLIEDLEPIKLTMKEIENLPDHLTALPNLQFKELKRRLVEIKKPFNIHSNISFILVVVGGLILCPIIGYVLWQIYRVCSRVKGFKPITKLFSEQKGEIFNISVSSFTCAKTFLRESGGIIKGLTCLLDRTLRYSYMAFMFCSKLITPEVNLAKMILISLIIATDTLQT